MVLALTHQLRIEKRRRGCIQKNTATEEVREVSVDRTFVKLLSPPPHFFPTDSRLLCQLLKINPSISRIITHCSAAERHGRLTAISNRFLQFFFLFSFFCFFNADFFIYAFAAFSFLSCYDLTSPRNSFTF